MQTRRTCQHKAKLTLSPRLHVKSLITVITAIGHRKEIRKLTFLALALRRIDSLRRKANAKNVSFRISLRCPRRNIFAPNGDYCLYIPQFSKLRALQKRFQLGENMLGYLFLDIVCSSKLTAFLELLSENCSLLAADNVRTDKYPRIFSLLFI